MSAGNLWGGAEREQVEAVPLYPGIELFCLSLDVPFARQEARENTLQINYCRTGQSVWRLEAGGRIDLKPGNFSLHTMQSPAELSFPSGRYQGLSICIDLREASACPPEPLRDTGLFPDFLQKKFCPGGSAAFLTGNERTESIFSGFYDPPEGLELPCRRVRLLELLLHLAGMGFTQKNRLSEYQKEQIETVRAIHDQLLCHMDRRVTIEELSRRYLINPTTLKAVFKAVYGDSIAAHIKEHRMEQAAKLLRETDKSVAEIAAAVGYESQSKFSAAFRDVMRLLPTAYRSQFRR